MSTGFKVTGVLVAGWLAQALASTDPDVDAGVEAYLEENYEVALERFDAAKERIGERPEIAFDRGLALLRLDKPDEARSAFERATEAEDDTLRASAHYELGNLDFDVEAYEAAIARYVDALKANPLHSNAKWNLELALLKKKEQEEEEEEEEQDEDEQDEDEQDEEGEDEEGEDEEKDQGEDEEEKDEGEQDEQDEGEQDEQEQDEGEQDEQDEGEQDEQEQDEQEQEQDEGEQDEGEQDEGEQDEGEQDEQDEGEQDEPQPAEPKPVDSMDMKRALEKLDEQDPFSLEKPAGGYVQPEKDW